MEATFEMLATLKALTYKTKHLLMLIETEKVSMHDGFHRHLVASAYKTAIAYNKAMESHGGYPFGIEYRNNNRDAWAFVLTDVAEPEKTRIQYFDRGGFVSHFVCDTFEEAFETMIREGYQIEDQGILETLSVTDEWHRGSARADLIFRLNTGKINWVEFLGASAALG